MNNQSTVGLTNAPSAGGFDSGALGPNQRYTVKLTAGGTYRFSDSANPELAGAIIVDGTTGHRVLLPMLQR